MKNKFFLFICVLNSCCMGGYMIPIAQIEISRNSINEEIYKNLYPKAKYDYFLEYQKTNFYIKIAVNSNRYENDVIYIKHYNGTIYDSFVILDRIVKYHKKCEDRLLLKIKYKEDTFDYSDYHRLSFK